MIALPWSRQPPVGSRANKTGIGSGLTLLATGFLNYNYANGASLVYTISTGTATPGTTIAGMAQNMSGSASFNQTRDVFGNGDCTALFLGNPTATAATKFAAIQTNGSNAIWFGANSDENQSAVSGQLCLGLLQSGVNRSSVKIASVIDGSMSCYLVGKKSGAGLAYKNGTKLTVTTSGTLAGAPAGSSDSIRIGGDSGNGSFSFSADLVLVAIWNRLLSDSEAAQVTRNPWVLFEPQRFYFKGSPGGAFTLTADAGSFTLSGQDATLSKSRILAADAGSFTLSGQDAALSRSYNVDGGAGAFTLTGQDATLTYTPAGSYTLVADAGAFTLTGQDATLLKTRILTADAGSFSLSGQSATLTWSGEPIVSTPREPQPGYDWGAWVRKLGGPETPYDAYQFTNRKFKDKGNPYE